VRTRPGCYEGYLREKKRALGPDIFASDSKKTQKKLISLIMFSYIQERGPHLSKSSIKTYVSCLNSFVKQMGIQGHAGTVLELLANHEPDVFNYIKCLSDGRVKLLCSALLFYSPGHTGLQNCIKEASIQCALQDEKQELTTAQKLAYKSWADILKVRSTLEQKCLPHWVKLNLSSAEYFDLQNYVIVSILTYLPPRRCLDYCLMGVDDQDPTIENCLVRTDGPWFFVFNRFKTCKKYGPQTVEIPDKLKPILMEWVKICKSKYICHISQSNLAGFRSDQFTRRIAAIFNQKGFGVNLLRHAYVSDNLLSQMPFLHELRQEAYKLGHSMNETVLYKKHT